MKYYKDGNNLIATIGNLDLSEITAEEYATEMEKAKERMEEQAKAYEAPPTETERLEAVEAALLELVGAIYNG